MAAKTLKIRIADRQVETFLEGEENQYTKRKTESYIFSGFGVSISPGWEWNRQLVDLLLTNFGRLPERPLLSVKDKGNNWEFCKLKITTIVVFLIMIQRIFLS